MQRQKKDWRRAPGRDAPFSKMLREGGSPAIGAWSAAEKALDASSDPQGSVPQEGTKEDPRE